MAKTAFAKTIEIKNRRAEHEYHFLSEYEAGMLLTGTEIKSIRQGKVNLGDAWCYFDHNELFVKNMYIAEYEFGTTENHGARRDRKLLLHRPELRKLERKLTEKGLTLVPYLLYITDRGFAKIRLVLAQGKKTWDKRETIKARESKRELDRLKKIKLS